MAVHQTRPKSSKGQRRTSKTLHVSQRDADGERVTAPFDVGGRDAPVRPPPPPRPETRHSGRLSQDDRVQRALPGSAAGGAGAPSLNKYKVLPSIERGRPGPGHLCAGKELPQPPLTGSRRVLQPAEGRAGTTGPTAGPVLGTCSSGDATEAVPSSDTLLLAIKDPGGRRFQQRFNPSDTLRRVRASAEATYGVTFGESATIETMEVPRRSFTDMSLTLGQCGISDRSVLCVFQPRDE